MKISTFHNLFVHKIQAIFDAERQILEAMPTLIELASSQDLKNGMKQHLIETEQQYNKLEKLCLSLDIDPESLSNLAIEGMIDETMELLQDNEPSPIIDAAIIAAAQAVEHYEISAYGTAAEWAENLGLTEAKQTLAEILIEEKKTDQLLSDLAVKGINKQAVQMSGQIPMGRMG